MLFISSNLSLLIFLVNFLFNQFFAFLNIKEYYLPVKFFSIHKIINFVTTIYAGYYFSIEFIFEGFSANLFMNNI